MKRNISKFVAVFLTAAMAVVPVASMAETVETVEVTEKMMLLEPAKVGEARFIASNGTVLELSELENGVEALVEVGETQYRVNLPQDMFVVDQEAAALGFVTDIKVGSEISFFTTAYTPVGMSNPAFITPEFVIVNTDANANYVGKVDENFMSSDMEIQFNIGEETAIIPQNGTKIALQKEALVGKDIIAIYSAATASIPTQTNPELVILLNDEEVIEEEVVEVIIPKFTNEYGIEMVGFAATAISNGYEVSWDAENQVATAVKDEMTVAVALKNGVVSINGKDLKVAYPMTTVEGRLFLAANAYETILL